MRSSLAATLSAALALAACAGGAPEPPSGGSPGPPPPGGAGRASVPRCPRLFVSPAGEPFRGEPGQAACPLAVWFAQADADHDGALTRTEFRTDALRFFAALDVNGDGLIDAFELQRYERQIVPEMLGRGGGLPSARLDEPRLWRAAYEMQSPGGMGGMGGQGGGRHGGGRRGGSDAPPGAGQGGGFGVGGLSRFGLLDEPEPVAASDLDFDGRITRAEFATRADQRFASLDEAQAGRLTLPALETRLRAKSRPPAGGGRRDGGQRAPGGQRGGRGGFGSPG